MKKKSTTVNIFCPTGEGGGVKPDCKAGAGGSPSVSGIVAKARAGGLSKITSEIVGDYVKEAGGDLGKAAKTARETAKRMGPLNVHTWHHEKAAIFLESEVGKVQG